MKRLHAAALVITGLLGMVACGVWGIRYGSQHSAQQTSSILTQIHAGDVLSSFNHVTSALTALDQGNADVTRRQLELTLDNQLTQLGAYNAASHICNPYDREGMARAREYYRAHPAALRRPTGRRRAVPAGLQFCDQTKMTWEQYWQPL